MSDRVGVLYCGTCGGLNPRTNHYCSACGHQLVDAYHASEGLRVYATPDPGAALVEIVDPGVDVTVLETSEDLPADFAKVALPDGRIGYIRLREVEAIVDHLEEPARREPVGCISSTALLAILVLLVLSATLILVTALRAGDSSDNLIAVIACLSFVPFFLFVVGFYVYVRKREDEILYERDGEVDAVQSPGNPTSETLSD